jgi:hypothetical protein
LVKRNNRSSAGVTRVLHLGALGQQAFASALAAAGQGGAAAFGFHAGTEAMLAVRLEGW